MKFPHYRQLDSMDCGVAALLSVARYYGREYSIDNIHDLCSVGKQGVSMLGINDAAEAIGI